jgi:hypothetical protein
MVLKGVHIAHAHQTPVVDSRRQVKTIAWIYNDLGASGHGMIDTALTLY